VGSRTRAAQAARHRHAGLSVPEGEESADYSRWLGRILDRSLFVYPHRGTPTGPRRDPVAGSQTSRWVQLRIEASIGPLHHRRSRWESEGRSATDSPATVTIRARSPKSAATFCSPNPCSQGTYGGFCSRFFGPLWTDKVCGSRRT